MILKMRKNLRNLLRLVLKEPVSLIDGDESPEENIYRLNESVLIREYLYRTEKQ